MEYTKGYVIELTSRGSGYVYYNKGTFTVNNKEEGLRFSTIEEAIKYFHTVYDLGIYEDFKIGFVKVGD